MAATKFAVLAALLGCVAAASAARMANEGSSVSMMHHPKRRDHSKGLPAPTKYKNARPLIGIVTQPCHDCPGK